MGQDASRPTDLSRKVQVIGAGFSRTGTVSFALAMEKLLKGPVLHSGTAILTREESFIRTWTSISSPKVPRATVLATLRDLTAGYVATTDAPAVQFTAELCELYPDAVVICTVRDVEGWRKSMDALVGKLSLRGLDTLFWPVPTLRWFAAWRDAIGMRFEDIYYGADEAAPDGSDLLEKHIAYVKRVVPPERLHFFDVRDGWAPLCKILNCPIPDEPFPRANDKVALEEYFKNKVNDALLRWAAIFGTAALVIGGGWRLYARR